MIISRRDADINAGSAELSSCLLVPSLSGASFPESEATRQDCRLLFEGVSEPWYSKTDRQLCLNIAREIYAYIQLLSSSNGLFLPFYPFLSFFFLFPLPFYYIFIIRRNIVIERKWMDRGRRIRAEKDKS